MRCVRRGGEACRPARRRRRERATGPLRSGGRGRWRRRRGASGRGNTCRQPVIRGGRAAPEDGPPGRDIGACVGPDLHAPTPSPSPPRQPLPKEGSHRRPKDTAASRGPAPERAPPGCGRRRRGEGDAGSEARREPLRSREGHGRGASPAKPRGRVRREDAPRRGAAAGHTSREEERDRGKKRRRPARAPGAEDCPERADVRVLPQTTHAQTPRREPHTHAPPGHPRSHHFSLRLYAHRAAAASTKAAAAAAAATAPERGPSRLRDPPPRHARELAFSPTWIPADRPAEARPRAGHVPHPSTTPDSHREFPTGHGQGNGRGGAAGRRERRRGAARERERRSRGGEDKGPEGRGGGQETDGRRARGAAAARPPPTTTPTRVWTWGDGGPSHTRGGPCEQTPSRATPPLSSGAGRGGGD